MGFEGRGGGGGVEEVPNGGKQPRIDKQLTLHC